MNKLNDRIEELKLLKYKLEDIQEKIEDAIYNSNLYNENENVEKINIDILENISNDLKDKRDELDIEINDILNSEEYHNQKDKLIDYYIQDIKFLELEYRKGKGF